MGVVPDEGAVEKLAAHAADPAFRVGVRDRGTRRGADDGRAVAAEDVIEALMNWPTPSRIRNRIVTASRAAAAVSTQPRTAG